MKLRIVRIISKDGSAHWEIQQRRLGFLWLTKWFPCGTWAEYCSFYDYESAVKKAEAVMADDLRETPHDIKVEPWKH